MKCPQNECSLPETIPPKLWREFLQEKEGKKADAAVKAQAAEIKRLEEYIVNGLKDFEDRAKRAIPDEVPKCECGDSPCKDQEVDDVLDNAIPD